MIKNIIIVFMGGGAGSIIRYLLSIYFGPQSGIPIGILLSNIIATLIAGIFAGYIGSVNDNPGLWLLLITGFAGGLSTFSSFSLDTYLLFNNAGFLAVLNMLLNITLCMIAVIAGFKLGLSIRA